MDAVELPPWADAVIADARAAGEDVTAGLELARKYGTQFPLPGKGATSVRWRLLAGVAAEDLTAARILEAHSDALAILDDAGEKGAEGTWGVFAAQAPTVHLEAITDAGGGVRLRGTQPWCSLAGRLDRALVVAHLGDERGLFSVDLHDPSVHVESTADWIARGLRNVASVPVRFEGTAAREVGPPGWYLTRPGFAWGGMGVAACWYGGALALAETMRVACAKRGGELSALYVGSVDVALHAASVSLRDAARRVDAGEASGEQGRLLALRVRAIVADSVERVINQVGHALGPAPLAFDEKHARRVADLELYVRQHHAERDMATLGESLFATAQKSRQAPSTYPEQ